MNKFNLLHENSEGYSRLIIELASTCQPTFKTQKATKSQKSNKRLDKIRKTILTTISGKYDLALERVIDILLDFIEEGNFDFIPLLSDYPHKTLCHILGFKFRYFYGTGRAFLRHVPYKLIQMCSVLIQNEVVAIDSCYHYVFIVNIYCYFIVIVKVILNVLIVKK